MSSTGRSDVRRKDDHYVTTDWSIKRLLESYRPPAGTWMDPCAAGGELIVVARSLRPECRFIACELRPEEESRLAEVVPGGYMMGDFLTLAKSLPDKSIDVILTNPPFSLAVEFLRECLRVAKLVIFNLRIGFVAGGRHKLTDELKPGLFIQPNRQSYTGSGADSSEYAWFVYGDPAVQGRYFMLGETSAEEIKAWNLRARKIHGPKPKRAKSLRATGNKCPECQEPQWNTPSGDVCLNGHGFGASS